MNEIHDNSDIHIAIIMATYNGEKFLEEQLDSIRKQHHENWSLHVSDDGSSDNTLTIIQEFSQRISQPIFIYSGAKKGFAQNFLSVIRNDDVQADFYAFCDQDDIWKEKRLSDSLKDIVDFGEQVPSVTFSRTELINDKNESIGFSPLFLKKPSLRNALIQSIGGGNTMLFNNKTRDLLKLISVDYKVISHDWTTYQVVSLCDGYVKYSANPNVFYRQHSENLIGSNIGLKSSLARFQRMLVGDMIEWNQANLKVLELYKDKCTKEVCDLITWFKKIRVGNIYVRLYYAFRANLYRQTVLGRLGLWLAILCKKL